ncbi:Biopolymer transport protein ExbD/TolR [Candidatus Koribacter versatilis Ellin345]|uniref:Biopolymer transport protein ExbD/TolR n=1 Tax=Koribacter versatilis (strain Ellin345) TaxID=204669 RepID=Q1IJE9_KORVE|nr:biopolymer transporter ExbD [Candidatus Koribacter versatilis]ABF43001.1 Biopolymer transport protein ExbD/TolR [Candidatus Koribacter versatilis Ellin345]
MAMLPSNSNSPKAEMNVTPLIDVLLVLLIIYMVITPLNSQGLKALIPQPTQPNSPAAPHENDAVVVQVLAGNGDTLLKINNESVTWEGLEPRLKAIFAPRVERVVFVKGDASVEFEQVARVVSLAHSAGIDHVGLLTAKVESAR